MPVIWLIDAYRAGERGQVRALVDALVETLAASSETKVLEYRKQVILPHALGQTTLRGITAESAATLCAPWPDLVISCGVRNEPVCRWICQQSGGHTRYVHVGRPWGSLDKFDLVITTPQYRIPRQSNVLHNMLTLHNVTPEKLAQARLQFQSVFAGLPRPYFAVIAGGDSGPFTLGPKAAARLAQEASSLARATGGSLLVSTSSRTSAAAVDALQANIDVPNYFYRWRPADENNPYFGILALADQLIVTGDSIAMLSESCATGRPVKIFDIGGMRGEDAPQRDYRWGGSLYALLMRWLWEPLSRDITLVHKELLASGHAVWMDQALTTVRVRAENDLQRSVAAVKNLL